MKRHRIHLKGPWEFRWLWPELDRPAAEERFGTAVPPNQGRIRMPTSWQEAFGLQRGQVRLTRRFGCPTNLDAGEKVYLVLDGLPSDARVSLNGKNFSEIENALGTIYLDVTDRLQPRNALMIELESNPSEQDSKSEDIWKSVAIEIRDDSPHISAI